MLSIGIGSSLRVSQSCTERIHDEFARRSTARRHVMFVGAAATADQADVVGHEPRHNHRQLAAHRLSSGRVPTFGKASQGARAVVPRALSECHSPSIRAGLAIDPQDRSPSLDQAFGPRLGASPATPTEPDEDGYRSETGSAAVTSSSTDCNCQGVMSCIEEQGVDPRIDQDQGLLGRGARLLAGGRSRGADDWWANASEYHPLVRRTD